MHIKHIIGIALLASTSCLAGCVADADTESSEPYEVETTATAQAAATIGETCGPDGDSRTDTDSKGCVHTTVTRCTWREHTSPPTYIYKTGTNGRIVKTIIPGSTYLSCDCVDLTTKDCPEEIQDPFGP